MNEKKPTIGLAICGSHCTHERLLWELPRLSAAGYDIIPILSEASATTDTRFGSASGLIETLFRLCGRPPMTTIAEVEPIGPKRLLEALVIAPCTGNTLAKLAAGIADTPITLAAKAHLRNESPVVVAVSTNDGLAAAARNIGELLNRKHYYFVPFGQDDCLKKPRSHVADMGMILPTLEAALQGRQIQPILLQNPGT